MAKLFNLKTYQKIDGDQHITMRLKDQHQDPANVITEKQLDNGRVEEKNVIIEKLLEGKRVGSADVVTERNLNESKGMFAPLRDKTTYTGNINKLEEKRLKGHRSETEKYEISSQIPKQKRWWEHLKAEASNDSMLKTAQVNSTDTIEDTSVLEPPTPKLPKKHKFFDNNTYRFKGGMDKDLTQFKPEEAFGLAGAFEGAEETGEIPTTDIPVTEVETSEDEISEGDIWLDEVNGYKETKTPIYTMTFKLRFDPDSFRDPEEIRQAALDKVLELKPSLKDKISIADFLDPEIQDDSGKIILPLIGESYFEGDTTEETNEDTSLNIIDAQKIYIGKKDVDGTPMLTGLVWLTPHGIELAKNEPEAFEQAFSDAVMEQRPELDRQIDTLVGSLNLSKVNDGKVSFLVSEIPQEENPENDAIGVEGVEASLTKDFQITILS